MSAERYRATYRIRCPADQIDSRAAALAVEQSVEMPPAAIRDAVVTRDVLAHVASIESDADGASHRIVLAMSVAATGLEAGQWLNMLFGNSSLHDEVTLVDVELPPSLCAALPGPIAGIEGIRERLGVSGRALTCSALKPIGSPPEALADLAYVFASAGIDIIKDDHGLADQAFAPFAERVALVQRSVARANHETGRRAIYAPSVSGGPARLAEQARVIRDEGVQMVLACPMLLGVPSFIDSVRLAMNVPVLAHPAFAGASRIAPALLLGRLFRAFGADATIFPNHGGRFAYDRDTCLAIAEAARVSQDGHRPILPVPAGGMRVERVEEIIADYGRDVMLLIGGNLLEAGDAMPERIAEFVARVEACSATGAADPDQENR